LSFCEFTWVVGAFGFFWGPEKIDIFPRKIIRDFFLLELTDFAKFLGKKLPN
jgi:hypothetical protein